MIAYVSGIWVYPIYKKLSPVPRIIFMLACSVFGGLLYILGEALNGLVWKKYKKTGIEGSKVVSTGTKTKIKSKRVKKE